MVTTIVQIMVYNCHPAGQSLNAVKNTSIHVFGDSSRTLMTDSHALSHDLSQLGNKLAS